MIDESRQRRIDELFHEACQLAPAEMDRFLKDACGNDSEMREELDRLLQSDRELAANDHLLADPPFANIAEQLMGVTRDLPCDDLHQKDTDLTQTHVASTTSRSVSFW